jgi:hypothetical protein
VKVGFGDGQVAHGDRWSTQRIERSLQHFEIEARRIGVERHHLTPRVDAGVGPTGDAQGDGVAEDALDRATE